MTGIILAAGFGTRMHPLTKNQPKSLLEVNGRPILDYLMEQLLEWGELTDLHIVANGRMYGDFYRWKFNWQDRFEATGCTLHLHSNGCLSPDDRPGAVGDLRRVLTEVDTSEGVLVTGGDSIYRFNLQALFDRYTETKATTVLALKQPNPQRLRDQSVLDLDGSRVKRVIDKPDNPPSDRVCPSIYLLSREAVESVASYLDEGGDEDVLGTLIDTIAQQHEVQVWRVPEGDEKAEDFQASDLRFHINTRYQLDKANEILEREPLLKMELG